MSLNQFNARLMTLISNANAIKKNKNTSTSTSKEAQAGRFNDGSISHRSQQPSFPPSKSPPKNRSSSGTHTNLISSTALTSTVQSQQQQQNHLLIQQNNTKKSQNQSQQPSAQHSRNASQNDALSPPAKRVSTPSGFQTGQRYLPLGHDNQIVNQQHQKTDFAEEMKKILAGSQPILQNKQMNHNNINQQQQQSQLQQSASASLLLSSSSSSKLHNQPQTLQQQQQQQQLQQQPQSAKKKASHGHSLSEVSENLYVLDGGVPYGAKQQPKHTSYNSYGSYAEIRSNNNTSSGNLNKGKSATSKSSASLVSSEDLSSFKKSLLDLRLPKLSAAAAAAVAAKKAGNISADLRSSSTQPTRETSMQGKAQDPPSTQRTYTETSNISNNNDSSQRKVLTESDDQQIADKHFLFTKPTQPQLTSTSLLRDLKQKKATQSAMYKQMASQKYSNHFRADSSGNGSSFLKQSFQQPPPTHKKGMTEAFAGIIGASSLISNQSSAVQSATRTPLEIVQLNNSQKQIINSSKSKQSAHQQHSNSLTSSSIDANNFKNYLKSRSKNVTPDGIQQRANTEASLTGQSKHTTNSSHEHLPDNRPRSSTPKNLKQQTPVANSHQNAPSLTPPKLQLQSPYGLRAPNPSNPAQKNQGQSTSISTAPSSGVNSTNAYLSPSPNFFPQKNKAQEVVGTNQPNLTNNNTSNNSSANSSKNNNLIGAHTATVNLQANNHNNNNNGNKANTYGNAGYKAEGQIAQQNNKSDNKQSSLNKVIKVQKIDVESFDENERPQMPIKQASKKEEIRQAEIHLNYFGQSKPTNNVHQNPQQSNSAQQNVQQKPLPPQNNQQMALPIQHLQTAPATLMNQQMQNQDSSRKGSECIPSGTKQPVIQQSVIQQYQYKTKAGCNYNGPKTNQDNYIIQSNVNNKSDRMIFSVCDGHGVNGHFCSAFLRRVLPKKIEEALAREVNNIEDDFVENSLHLAFLQTSKELLESSIDCTFSGSTCVLLLIIGKKMWSANTGDSRAIMCSGTEDYWYANPLSRDHKPDDPEEYQRIISRGGRVETYLDENFNPVGPYRVWLQDENIPGLAMARSFGDVIASQVGVTCEPEVMSFEIGEEDRFIVLASDGVWEFISNEEVMSMLIPSYEENDIEAGCTKVVKESNASWRRNDDVVDDITCIVIYLNP